MNEQDQRNSSIAGNGADLNELISRLKQEDTRNLRLFNRFRYMFLVLIVLYSLMFIVNPMRELGWMDRITGICYVLAFIVLAWLFQKYHREYSAIDYALPVTDMLEAAARRYSLKQRKTLILIIPLLLIDLGITISISQHWEMFPPEKWIWIVQLFYFPLLIVSYSIGVLIWYRRQKPLRDAARRLLNELKGMTDSFL